VEEQVSLDQRRVLPLQGGVNFRDLGGYRTEDGRQIRWETIYRSGTMSRLSAEDWGELARRGLRTICDLRDNSERRDAPHSAPPGDASPEYWVRSYEEAVGDLARMLKAGCKDRDSYRRSMLEIYREIPEQHAESYAQLFRYLAAGKVPLAFNCTAGKDRTGILAALLLSFLGVPRETIMDDYALTNSLMDFRSHLSDRNDPLSRYRYLADMPWDIVEPLFLADRSYIDHSLSVLEERYGSVDEFITRRLGVTPEMREAILGHALTE